MDAFVTAVATGGRSLIQTGTAETLRSRLAVFAAKRARSLATVEWVEPETVRRRVDTAGAGTPLLRRIRARVWTRAGLLAQRHGPPT